MASSTSTNETDAPVKPANPPVLRRVGLIGDVHGEDAALAAALDFLRSQPDLDALLCTGDVPRKAGIGDTGRCAALLMDVGAFVIRGNHDRWFGEADDLRDILGYNEDMPDAMRQFVAGLPPTRVFETSGGSLLLCHGLGKDDMAGIYPGGDDAQIAWAMQRKEADNFRYLVAGHTHQRMIRRIDETTIINAGTLCYDKEPGFFVLDFAANLAQWYTLTPFTNQITKAESYPLGNQ